MKKQSFPKRWNEERVNRVIKYYESQSDDEAAGEIEASTTLMGIPMALVSDVRQLIAKRRSARVRQTPRAKPAAQRKKARAT